MTTVPPPLRTLSARLGTEPASPNSFIFHVWVTSPPQQQGTPLEVIYPDAYRSFLDSPCPNWRHQVPLQDFIKTSQIRSSSSSYTTFNSWRTPNLFLFHHNPPLLASMLPSFSRIRANTAVLNLHQIIIQFDYDSASGVRIVWSHLGRGLEKSGRKCTPKSTWFWLEDVRFLEKKR